MQASAFDTLWQAVHGQTGPAHGWHLDNLRHHARRYALDLQIVQRLAPRGTVVDLGAAPCHMTALLALTGHDVVGVDVDPARVADFVAALALDVQRCDFERERLPFADHSVGCVLLCETFEHLRIDPPFASSAPPGSRCSRSRTARTPCRSAGGAGCCTRRTASRRRASGARSSSSP